MNEIRLLARLYATELGQEAVAGLSGNKTDWLRFFIPMLEEALKADVCSQPATLRLDGTPD